MRGGCGVRGRSGSLGRPGLPQDGQLSLERGVGVDMALVLLLLLLLALL